MFQATRDKVKAFVVWLMMLNDTPHSIAMGVAVGFFVALTPTLGLQILLVTLISLFIRCNRTAGCVMVLITNPLTMVPIYFFNYRVGTWLLGMTPLSWESFWGQFRPALVYRNWYHETLATVRVLAGLTIEIVGPLWFGSVVVGLVLAPASYFIVRRTVIAHRRAHQRRLEAALAAQSTDGESTHGKTSAGEALQDR